MTYSTIQISALATTSRLADNDMFIVDTKNGSRNVTKSAAFSAVKDQIFNEVKRDIQLYTGESLVTEYDSGSAETAKPYSAKCIYDKLTDIVGEFDTTAIQAALATTNANVASLTTRVSNLETRTPETSKLYVGGDYTARYQYRFKDMTTNAEATAYANQASAGTNWNTTLYIPKSAGMLVHKVRYNSTFVIQGFFRTKYALIQFDKPYNTSKTAIQNLFADWAAFKRDTKFVMSRFWSSNGYDSFQITAKANSVLVILPFVSFSNEQMKNNNYMGISYAHRDCIIDAAINIFEYR